ncbi:hypothetical protein Hanom_Chr12g01174531 [Helianthus anomalus]
MFFFWLDNYVIVYSARVCFAIIVLLTVCYREFFDLLLVFVFSSKNLLSRIVVCLDS